MSQAKSDGRDQVWTAVHSFAAALHAAPAVRRFAEAEQRLRTDAELRIIQDALRSKSEALRLAQQEGSLRPEPLRELREAQATVQRHPIVEEFTAARVVAAALLRATNAEISGLLGLDFARLAGRSGGCCS
jgi:cell fate (sporulation/competence/biofilm development) regulator YlbF (YheA/YmcA/DUF963 family)